MTQSPDWGNVFKLAFSLIIMKRVILTACLLLLTISLLSFVSAAGTSFDDAQLVTPGEYSSGVLAKGQVDYYKIDLKSGQYLSLIGEFFNNPDSTGKISSFPTGIITTYNPLRETLFKATKYESKAPKIVVKNEYTASSKESGMIYFSVAAQLSATGTYTLKVSLEDYSDAGSGEDVADTFEGVYQLELGKSYTGSVVAGTYGKDTKDMYRLSVKKGSKIGIKLTPESTALLGISVYNSDREKISSNEGANEGAISSLEYTSPESGDLYFSVDRDFYGAAGGKYTLELSDLGKGTLPVCTPFKEACSSKKDSVQICSSDGLSWSLKQKCASKSCYETEYGAYCSQLDSSGSSGSGSYSGSSSFGLGLDAFAGFFMALLLGLLLVSLIVYVYTALAIMSIAKKTNTSNAWFAWVPILNFILLVQIAEMPWWYAVGFLVPVINMFFGIFVLWKVFERRNYPGLLALTVLLPLINLIVLGVVAWKDRDSSSSGASSLSK